jgi:3-oxoacyl-[acyl-carrier-protein] synthase-1
MNPRRVYLSALGMSTTLGQEPAEILASVFGGPPPTLAPETIWREGGAAVVVGRLRHEPPALAAAWRDLASRNCALLATVLDSIRAQVQAAVARFGADRVGVVLGTSTSGIFEGEAAFAHWRAQGTWPADYHYHRQELGAAAEFLARYAGVEGPAYTISTACTSSGKALIAARHLIQAGLVDAVITGGADTLCRLTVRGFAALEATSKSYSSPFTQARDGINLGEGAALFLLTREAAAIEFLGAGEASDAHHISAPDPAGAGAERALRQALEEAGLTPGQIDYVNLHGTGTGLNDAMESALMARVFGPAGVWASSTKPLTGHTLGAAAAIELGICWLLLSGYNPGRRLPAQVWHGDPDTTLPPLRFTVASSVLPQSERRVMMSNSFAFGGSNVSLILGEARP